MPHRQAFAKTLKMLRTKHGLTQESLGLETELGQNYISELERGTRDPGLGVILRLARALQIKPSEFMKRIETRLK